ncbi:hypothetical protein [Corynebacterium caspium]|uniref:hypothetical protein n=1 Tax=Corynebacterium caspium TaxID=234828 RepID=UPI000476F994|nr:hypothetical protein [Corynebacterium caspium]WKD59764.1 hypothetical protein CCASP_06925 [Corynebacterium caspium DSM 44850]
MISLNARLLAGGATLLLAAGSVATATAVPQQTPLVYTDTQAERCSVNNEVITNFWQSLAASAVEVRLRELETVDPGITAAIKAYEQGGPEVAAQAGELQLRLVAAGAAEGLGMLTSKQDSTMDFGESVTPQAAYTREEAINAAERMSADPIELAHKGLAAQAASGVRVYELQQELFADQAAEYVDLQTRLHDGLLDCAAELKKPPYGWIAMGGIGVLGLLILAVVAWRNSRRPGRHAAP